MKKILGIGGSPRKGGNSDILLKQLLKNMTIDEARRKRYGYRG